MVGARNVSTAAEVAVNYQIYFFAPPKDGDPWAIAEAGPPAEADPGTIEPAAEVAKQRIATALTTLDPTLQVFPFKHEDLARFAEITVEEAQRRWRHYEIAAPSEGTGVQIVLHDAWATVGVPFLHDGPAAEAVLAKTWEYIRVVASMGNYYAFDRQLGRFLDFEADYEAFFAAYIAGEGETSELMASVAMSGVRRPKAWWRFW